MKQIKDCRFEMRLTKADYNFLQNKAKDKGLTVSDLIRLSVGLK